MRTHKVGTLERSPQGGVDVEADWRPNTRTLSELKLICFDHVTIAHGFGKNVVFVSWGANSSLFVTVFLPFF